MKRYFFLVVILLFVSTILAEAQSSSFNAFLKSRPTEGFTESSFKKEIVDVIEGRNLENWHKGAREAIISSMVEIFGEDAKKEYREIISASSFRPLKTLSGCKIGRLSKATGALSYWNRPGDQVYDNEEALFIGEIPWISAYCGNTIKKERTFSERREVVEDDSFYERKSEKADVREYVVSGTSKVVVINNTIPVAQQAVAQPVIIYQQPQMVQPAVIQQPMYQQTLPPPAYYDNGPREVVVKTKPHWVDYVNLGLNAVDLGVDIYSAVRQDRYQRENRYAFSQIQNQLVHQQQQRRSTPRYRNDWPNGQSPYYPGYDNDPNDFQGPGGSLWTTGGGSSANTWTGQQDIFSNTGYYTGGNNNGNIFAGSGSPYNYWATGYGPNGTHYYENGYTGGTYTGGSTGGNTHYYENGYRPGAGANGNQYTENNYRGGGNTNTGNGNYTENNYTGGNTGNNNSSSNGW